ncbi:hypothetical protein KSC_073930 [Ktedonobacter sp. SOSP1-52]|uniref:mannosyltransferase family protein n=1 Tax=Ktedonobacter sp. SOSP1-52 TaxID=2778366 RepID=UPI001915E487|nr:mannosyltransferase family protein [Ktedonobacter sp. SOSP1-52]GHO68501.1 hypothetical protein KSC_073930 [Ktedonobacter sp. SOSP1-52]
MRLIRFSRHKGMGCSETSTPHAPRSYRGPFCSEQKAGHLLAWYQAAREVVPLYLALHVAFFVGTCYSLLYTLTDFSWRAASWPVLAHSWEHWDSLYYEHIAIQGYSQIEHSAFFPLYPLLIRLTRPIIPSPYLAGTVIAHLAWFVLLMVFYRLVQEDFVFASTPGLARRSVLYLSLFPTAFFFGTVYTESLFLCLALLSFYAMRKKHWWWAGLFGFAASLTRSAGILLLLPFCYEYLQHSRFRPRRLRPDGLSAGLFVLGPGLYAFYCYHKFGDWLAFSHVQARVWTRLPELPWFATLRAFQAIQTGPGLLSFQGLRNVLDLSCNLFVLGALLLGLVGPWRFSRRHTSYLLFGIALFLFIQLLPVVGDFPLQSFPRYLLMDFPAFIILANIGQSRAFHLHYLLISGCLLFLLLTQFVTGRWIT